MSSNSRKTQLIEPNILCTSIHTFDCEVECKGITQSYQKIRRNNQNSLRFKKSKKGQRHFFKKSLGKHQGVRIW